MWSLGAADRATGGGAWLPQFDLDRSGMLDELEFSRRSRVYYEYTRDLFVELRRLLVRRRWSIKNRALPTPFWSTACTLEGLYR